MDYLASLRNMIQSGVVTGPADNTQQFPVQQMSYKDKLANILQIFPYGMYSNVSSKDEDSLGVIFSVDGYPENKASLSYTPKLRPVDLEDGETAYYHPYTNTFIKLRNNGDLDIETGPPVDGDTNGNINITAQKVNVVGAEDVSIEAADNISLSCGETCSIVATTFEVTVDDVILTGNSFVNVITPEVDFSDDIKVNGGQEVIGDSTLSGTVTSNGKDISDTHLHAGSPTAPVGIVSPTGVVV